MHGSAKASFAILGCIAVLLAGCVDDADGETAASTTLPATATAPPCTGADGQPTEGLEVALEAEGVSQPASMVYASIPPCPGAGGEDAQMAGSYPDDDDEADCGG